jgi:S-DNA-T family DNA segregation ATPase FtsK/SpoIIIE
MLRKWMNQLKNLLRDEYDHQPIQRSQYQQGSFSFLPKEVEGRVQNIYPKAGSYRFPLDIRPQKEDEGKPEQEHGQVIKYQESKAKSSSVSWEPKSKKNYFQGNLKESIPTPSPIYGYQKLNDRKKMENKVVPLIRENATQTEKVETLTNINEEIELGKVQLEEIQYKKNHEIEDPDKIEQELEEQELEKQEIEDQEIIFKEIKYEGIKSTGLQNEEQNNTGIQIEEIENGLLDRVSTATLSKPDTKLAPAYQFPKVSSLHKEGGEHDEEDDAWIDQQATTLMETFQHFGLKAELIGVTQGPTVTRYEIQPAPGIKISKFTNLQDDLKLSLAAKEIRIEAPIPGKHAIGIEVPNLKPRPVHLGSILASDAFDQADSPLTICLGSDLSGEPVVTDIQKMPHGLIAGSTGSGKSVCINSILVSLLYKASPEKLRLLLIDPKVVELSPYQSIPHLVTPVVTDPKRATASLKWAVEEMERRYQLFAQEGVRDLARYNKVVEQKTGEEITLPYIVIIIDELADLMMVSPQDVEDSICRITQKARACGIHLIVATQRPSVDVITGLIKANIPTRLAFSVSSQVDSRTILDMSGAERLLGKGDMLFLQNGAPKPIRVQGNFVSDEEIESIIKQVSASDQQRFLFSQEDLLSTIQESDLEDELSEEAAFLVMEQGVASASSLQRKFRIGYNRAARLIDWMEEQGMISESLGSKPRSVNWSQDQFLEWLDRDNEKK